MQYMVTLSQIRRVRIVCGGKSVATMDLNGDKSLARPPLDNEVLEARDAETNSWSCYRVVSRRVFPIFDIKRRVTGYQMEVIAKKMRDC